MILSKLFIELVVYSFIGWIYECSYCTLKTGHWQNRGFLFGPVCPIYGTGGIGVVLVFGAGGLMSRINGIVGLGTVEIPVWEVFLVCAVGSIFLEYTSSYLLEKLFHAVWWDYSNIPLNINGRVCLPATLGFGVAGVLIYRFVLPVSSTVKAAMPPLLAEFIALLLMAYVSADLVLTVSSLTQLLSKVEAVEQAFNEKAEDAYQKVAAHAGALTFRQRYVLANVKRMSTRKGSEAIEKLKEAMKRK